MPTNSIVTNASGIPIRNAFERIVANHIPNQRWLGNKNYYSKDTIERIKTDTSPNLVRRKNQMSEYISASVILHNYDAWNYLSSAIEGLMNGHISNAIHLAYYAELRSCMSLLAYEGIGIFNYNHIWFDAANNPTRQNNPGTHQAVTDSMNEWAKLNTKKEVLFKLIKVNNNTLTDWIRESGVSTKSSYASAIVNNWLKKWSIDLHLKKDRDLRNEMSYRPHFQTSTVNIEDAVNKLTEIWNILEPTDGNRFPILDKYLLRISLEQIFKKTKGKQPNGVEYENFITNIFQRLGESVTSLLFDFLLRRIEANDHLIFVEARKDRLDIDINREDPLPIICRAILMLRLSTGVAQDLIAESSINVNDLRYWWENVSLQQGSIDLIPSGIDAIDLYSDIRDSISEINSLPPGSMNCIKDAYMNAPNPLFYMKQFHRTAIWGMGL